MKAVTPLLRRTTAVVAIALATTTLSACGFDNPTDRVYNPAVGVSDRAGSVDVLNAVIVSADDGTGQLVTALVDNDIDNDDELRSVKGAGDDAAISVAQTGPVTIKAGGLTQLANETPIVVTGDQIQAGRFVTLTLTFAQGEPVTLTVPVVANTNEFAQITPPPASATTSGS